MAIVFSYPTILPTVDDLLIGADMASAGEDAPRTRTFTVGSIINLSNVIFAPINSPVFTGTPYLPTGTTGVTQPPLNSSYALATTQFVTTADNLKANLDSPSFTGTPSLPTGTTAITQASTVNNTTLATTQYVTSAGLLKADLISPSFSGTPSLPTGTTAITQTQANNSQKIATTAYVDAGLATKVTATEVSKVLYRTVGTTAQTPPNTGSPLTVAAMVTIPAYTVNQFISINNITFTKSGTVNGAKCKVWVSKIASFSEGNSTLVATFNITGTSTFGSFQRTLGINPAQSGGSFGIMYGYNFVDSSPTDIGTSTLGLSSTSVNVFDRTVQMYMYITVEVVGAVGDSVTVNFINITT